MCGIAGFVDFKKQSSEDTLRTITDKMVYRGPDDAGYFFEQRSEYSLGLGQRRLSIIDLSANGHQPMFYEHLSIVFNGEIYNYVEIREELLQLGHKFISNSDTEVILKGFYSWGESIVDKLIGMFAIAIFDNKAEELYLIRDRAGVKPLYFFHNNNQLVFASELKAILAYPNLKIELDDDGLAHYLTLGYVPAPYSIVKGVQKLRPGNILHFNLNKNTCTQKPYWDIINFYNKPRLNITYDQALLKLEKLFLSAFQYRLVSDVAYGIFFSGGYDSTAVTAMLQANSKVKFRTFTIGFSEAEVDESRHAAKLADYIGTEHTTFICTEQDALDIVEELPVIFDEPISDNSCIPTYLLSKITKQHVTVALSADGGDELMGGYDKYYANLSLYQLLEKTPTFFKGLGRLLLNVVESLGLHKAMKNGNARIENLRLLLSDNKSEAIATKIQAKLFTQKELSNLLQTPTVFDASKTAFADFSKLNDSLELLNKLYAVDYKTFMVDDILVKVDRAAMAVSLEGREPLLDHRIAEFLAQLPVEYKFRNGLRKSLLKDIVHKYVPKEMIDRPKQGFVIPLDKWLRNDLAYLLDKYLSEEKILQSNIFKYSEVLAIRSKFEAGSTSDSDRLWRILILQMWYFQYMHNEA
jgi:asparagine synthase (glutamine-hydrolysing)